MRFLKEKDGIKSVWTPIYKTSGSAGFDIPAIQPATVPAHGIAIIKTGLFLDPDEIPMASNQHLVLDIRSRSGMAAGGIIVANAPGTVDVDYRGEIGVILLNTTDLPYHVTEGQNVAQGVILNFVRPDPCTILGVDRGIGGFGSTGK